MMAALRLRWVHAVIAWRQPLESWSVVARRRAAAGIFLLALIVGFAIMVTSPWAYWQSLRRDVAQLEHQLNAGPALDGAPKADALPMASAPASAAWLARRLPVDDERAALLDTLDRLADAHGVQIDTLRPLPGTRHDGYRTVPVQLRASGSFRAIAAFVDAIGAMPRLADLHDLALAPVDAGRIVLDTQVRAYAVNDDASGRAGADDS